LISNHGPQQLFFRMFSNEVFWNVAIFLRIDVTSYSLWSRAFYRPVMKMFSSFADWQRKVFLFYSGNLTLIFVKVPLIYLHTFHSGIRTGLSRILSVTGLLRYAISAELNLRKVHAKGRWSKGPEQPTLWLTKQYHYYAICINWRAVTSFIALSVTSMRNCAARRLNAELRHSVTIFF